MTRFVLVHGAWHGGWCWDRVVPMLRAAGHRTQAPTLAGLGERSAELTPETGLATHVEDVVSVLHDDEQPAVLVGHSYSGLVVREAAALAPAHVRELVLVDAWVGPPGSSLLSLAPDWFAEGIHAAATATGEGWRIPVPDPAVVGVTEPEDVRRLSELLTEHPLRSFEEPAEREPPPELPQRAVLAAPGPVPMDEMARALMIPATRIEGGHDLMVTSPEALTATLLESA